MVKEKIVSLLKSALRGRLFLRLGVERFLIHILFLFGMIILYIALNIAMESTVHRKEENKKTIENLQSIHTELKCKLTSLDSVCQVEDMLDKMGSDVKIPRKQASKVGR